ncbi:unnamed protein product [Closterium sp. Yama58-4]|nr:unnamed protein product [Closterium sp. Yama58-4]
MTVGELSLLFFSKFLPPDPHLLKPFNAKPSLSPVQAIPLRHGMTVGELALLFSSEFLPADPQPTRPACQVSPLCLSLPHLFLSQAIPLHHGMTVGELALLFSSEFLPPDPHLAKLSGGDSLEVVHMEGWTRSSSPFFPFFPYPQPLLSPSSLPSHSPAPVSAPPPSPSPSHSTEPVPAPSQQHNVSLEAPPSASISPPATVAALLSSATVAGATAASATVPTALQPLLWVPPSPNMPTPTTALVYAGTCLIEGTNLSEGRGTTLPFQLIGAPFMDHRFAQAVRDQRCPGCAIREAYFSPVAGKYSGKQVCGIEIHVTDPASFEPLHLALILLITARSIYPSHFHWRNDSPTNSPNGPFWIDKLAGSDSLRNGIDSGRSVDEIKAGWQPQLMWFSTIRAQYLLYS